MFKKLIIWLIVLGLSFLIQGFGLAPQGKAFMVIFTLFLIISAIITSYSFSLKLKDQLIAVAIGSGISIFVSWIISKLFNVDFYTSYQILVLISCIFNTNN